MSEALDWAEMYVKMTEEERIIIMQSKKSFLHTGDTPWVKKGPHNFDVGMGAWDGAESSDLIGLFMLSELEKLEANIGVHRDDGLLEATCSPREIEKLKQDIISIYQSNGFRISIDANRKQVNFLDVTLDLENEIFKPYIKPGDTPLYVNSNSNHPPGVVKNIPAGINRRLSTISSNKQIFDNAAPLYQRELDRNNYKYTLQYDPPTKKKRCRSKRALWFNPPYSINVKTHVGGKFLGLLDKHFPPGHPLHPLLNRNTVKVSYKCLPNMASIIAKNNSRNLNIQGPNAPAETCNCRNKMECPLPGKCQTPALIYQATVETVHKSETYIGLSAPPFKLRFGGHKSSFKHEARKKETTLSKYIWELKEESIPYTLSWKIMARAQPFSQVTGIC